MDSLDTIKPDIITKPGQVQRKTPSAIPNIPRPILFYIRTIQPSRIWVQIYPSNPASSWNRPPSTPGLNIRNSRPLELSLPPLNCSRCSLDREVHALLSAAITNSPGKIHLCWKLWSRENEKQKRGGGSERPKPRPLKPASICRDRKLGDHNLIVAFRTSSHRIGNILCCSLAGCLLPALGYIHERATTTIRRGEELDDQQFRRQIAIR